MSISSQRTLTALALAIGLLAALPAIAQTPAAMDDKALAAGLRTGGFVIVVRHGATFPDQADTDPFHPDNIAAQRNLNDKGKALATAFGAALKQIDVPVGRVYTSLFNRAYETAVLAGLKNIEKTADLTEGGLVVSPNENNRRAEALRKMLAVPPNAGTNTILITHKPNIIRRAGQGLVRSERRRGIDLPPGERLVHAGCESANGGLAADRRNRQVDTSAGAETADTLATKKETQ